MTILHVNKLEVGAVLAEEVVSPQGMKIAAAGDTISDKHLKAFKAWGVTEVSIRGEEDEAPENADEEKPVEISEQALAQELDLIFKKTDRSNPVIAELYDLALKAALTKEDSFLI